MQQPSPAATKTTRPASRNVQLDALRGIAILLVLCSHFYKVQPDVALPTLASCLQVIRDMGWVGVDLFFVLSGFLVSGLIFSEYQKHKQFQAGRFLIRRGFKIYPAYYICFLVGFLVIPSSARDPATVTYLTSICIFVQNYFYALANSFTETIFSHFWSLSVEEHFYLGLSIVLLAMIKLKGNFKSLPPLCLTICVAVLCLRHFACWGRDFGGQFDYAVYTPTHFRIDALTFGVLLSYWYHFENERLSQLMIKGKKLWLALSLALIAPCSFWSLKSYFTAVFGLTMLYVGFGLLLLVVIHSPAVPYISKSLARVGFYSYSIYIWHRLVWFAVVGLNTTSSMPYFVADIVYFTLSIIIGVAMGKLIELPFLAIRDKVFPSRSLATTSQ